MNYKGYRNIDGKKMTRKHMRHRTYAQTILWCGEDRRNTYK